MKLKNLLKEIPGCQVHGSEDILVTGVSAHSKLIAPGNVFIAKKGKSFAGTQFIPEAMRLGASVIVSDVFDPSLQSVAQVVHPQVSAIESALAANFYRHPSHALLMVGLTGTNGKTTTSFIIKSLLDRFLGPCGLIGTIENIVGRERYPAKLTTPDVTSNHKMLRQMVDHGCRSAVMEVTSIGLDQGRVDKIDFDVALFSNLTLDHLDYHLSMEEYARAKKRLFEQLENEKSHKNRAKWAIVNQDSPWSSYMMQGISLPHLSYGFESSADLHAADVRLGPQGTHVCLTFQGQSEPCFWPLIGRFNVYNCLAAMAVLLSQGISFKEIIHAMPQIPFVRGRLQPVPNALGYQIYVDFAHSDDALLNVLSTLMEVKKPWGRLIVVFGCGGDRDRSKRPKMARACEKYADLSIVTTDNPRSEDPHQICQETISGFSNREAYEVELDRKIAIQKAIEMANGEDVILIAGKGHETYQIFADKTVEFDDCLVASEICMQLVRKL